MKKYSKITESIIDDILTRNKSGEVKVEDNIDLLDLNDFYNYVKTHYEVDTFKIDRIMGGFQVPVIRSKQGGFHSLDIRYFSSDNTKIREIKISLTGEECELIFKDKYKLVYSFDGLSWYKIFPKDETSKLSNSFFLDVLNTIIENGDRVLIKKIK